MTGIPAMAQHLALRWVLLSGKRFLLSEIAAGNYPPPENAFARTVLEFCQEWLSEKKYFPLTTSGSTGNPKQITAAREAMESSAIATGRALQLKAGYTALLCLDPRYIAGKMMLVRSMTIGMNIIAMEPSANPFRTLPPDVTVDFTALVPYQLQHILADPVDRIKLRAVRSVLIGGAELDYKTRSELDEFPTAFYATYGMTETLSHIALQKCNPPGEQDYFQVLPGIQIQQDDRGCLVISGAHVGGEKIITNDIVELAGQDRFVWLGRFDSVINTGGVKVIPEKIESTIARIIAPLHIPNRFFICGLPDSSLGNKITMVVEGTWDVNELKMMDLLRSGLSRFELPREIKMIESFVETDTQKINRKATISLIR